MEQAPLPPHERAWRHPSELAAEQRALIAAEPTSRSTRALALATGTMGLLAVGLLMVAVTPKGTEAPIAIGSSPSVAAASPSSPRQSTTASAAFGLRGDTTVRATPIGDGRFAVVTRASLVDQRNTIVDVMLPDGNRSLGSIVTASDDAVVVALADPAHGHRLARQTPRQADMVTVMADPPIEVTFADLASLEVDEGVAVLDERGALVGLCSHEASTGEVRLVDVSVELAAATRVVP